MAAEALTQDELIYLLGLKTAEIAAAEAETNRLVKKILDLERRLQGNKAQTLKVVEG